MKTCEVGLLGYVCDGHLAGCAAGCECWDGGAVDGGIGFDSGVFPFREGDELSGIEVFPALYDLGCSWFS